MKIETRKRKSATQKVKSNFSLVQRASVLFLLFKRSLRYPFGHSLTFWSFVQLFCWHSNEEKKGLREILANKICCLQRPATEKRITIVLTTRMVVFLFKT